MKDYIELVARLREFHVMSETQNSIFHRAADAIETLQKENLSHVAGGKPDSCAPELLERYERLRKECLRRGGFRWDDTRACFQALTKDMTFPDLGYHIAALLDDCMLAPKSNAETGKKEG
jgi:hypothetical protein